MLFDSHSLHVALGQGPPRCAGPAAPRRLHRPPVAVTATHHERSPGSIAHTQEGCSFFQPCAPTTVVSTSLSGRVRHAVRVPLPLAAFAALLSPRPSPRPHRRRGAAAFNKALLQSIVSTSPSGRWRWPPPDSYHHHTWSSPSISTWTLQVASAPPLSSSLSTGPSQPPGFCHPNTGPSWPRLPAPAPSTPQA